MDIFQRDFRTKILYAFLEEFSILGYIAKKVNLRSGGTCSFHLQGPTKSACCLFHARFLLGLLSIFRAEK
jgi:hypothetical protein